MKFEPGTKLGPYQILGELGRGGMATVYRAYQPSLEREVAIKILPDFLVEQPGFKARFHREAVAVARLQHPNILSVYDHGEQDGVTYIVSEYVEGGTLASRMGAPIQLDYCVRILRPIADALDYAHSEGVIHRDVKPSNVLLDRRGTPILSDFGLARVSEEGERLTQTGAMVGTPTYMAPEQCSGGEVGAPADIYALAIIAFEMVTGRVPFGGTNPLSVIAAQQTTPPPSPRKFNPSLPASIEQPLLTGLAKDPAHRPATASDFVEALAAAIPGVASQYPMTPPPVQPLPPTPTAIEPPPSPSYPSVAPPPYAAPQYTPPPPATPQYTPPPPVAASPYASPPPYATAAATPPPSYPAMTSTPVQQQYTPAPGYVPPAPPQQQWIAPPAARREGAPGWVLIALWVGFALTLLIAIAAVFVPFGTGIDDGTRGLWVSLGLVSTVAAALSLMAAVGLSARDRWAPGIGWGSVAALTVTVIGVPIAAVVGWGLAQAPKGSLVAPQSRPGGGLRAGLPLAAGALMIIVITGTTVYGWSQAGTGTPVGQASPSARPAACDIILPDTPINTSAVGTSCGLTPASMITALDCTSVTALPGPLSAVSWDYTKQAATNVGTLSIDSAGCHLATPAYRTSSELDSRSKVDPSNVLMVADFQQPQGKMDVGLSYGCDDTGCITTDLYTVDSSVYVGEDDNSKLVSQTVKTRLGVNRLVLVIQGNQIRSWFNGTLIATETAGRAHGAGIYEMWMIDYDKTGPAALSLMRFGVINLT